MTVVTDNFNRANESPIGGNWTTGQNGGLKISSNQVTVVNDATSSMSYWSGNTFLNNQYSQVKVATPGATVDAGPCVRCNNTSGGNYYKFQIYSGADVFIQIGKTINGTWSLIAQYADSNALPVANDILKITVNGSNITGYKNLQPMLVITDGSLTTGSPGLFIHDNDIFFDDFEGGDFSELTALYPLGSIGTSQSSTANQSSFTLTTILQVDIGNLIVLIIACDNYATTDGDEGAVSSVTDSASNTWTKGAEFTNGQGSAGAGATCSLWWCQVTATLAVSSTITVSLTNNTSRDKTCSTAYSFYAPGAVSLEGTPGTLANDGADPGSLNVTTINTECLRVRGIAAESSSTTVLTATPGWWIFDGNQTTGGGTAGNMGVRGEFIVSTGTGAASDPSLFSADCASVYIALKASGAITKPLFKRRPYMVRI